MSEVIGIRTGTGAGNAGARPIIVRRSTAVRHSVVRELIEAIREVWQARELLLQLVRRDILIRYHQAIMGFAWALFMPLMIVLSGSLVRVAMATVSGQPLAPEALGATAVKAIAWSFFVGALGTGTASLLGNTALITKLYFPREVLPLSALLTQCVDTAIGAIALALILPFMGLHVSAALLWIPLLVVMLVAVTLVFTLFTSCANLFFRDVKYIVQVVLTFGIFLTPVFFDPGMLGPVIGPLIMLNPVSPMIEGLSLVIIHAHNLLDPIILTNSHGVRVLAWTPWYLVYSAVWSVAGLLGTVRIFRRSAVLFAEYA